MRKLVFNIFKEANISRIKLLDAISTQAPLMFPILAFLREGLLSDVNKTNSMCSSVHTLKLYYKPLVHRYANSVPVLITYEWLRWNNEDTIWTLCVPNTQISNVVGSLSPPGGILYFIACKYYLLHYLQLNLVEESNTLITLHQCYMV